MSLKNLLLIITTIISISCWNGKKKAPDNQAQANSILLTNGLDSTEINNSNEDRFASRFIESFKFDTVAYQSIERIDSELHAILSADSLAYDLTYAELYTNTLLSRLEFHLSNPLTFSNNLPKTSSRMEILQTPDKKYKFYSFDDGTGGTIRSFKTFIQFNNSKGNLVSKLFDEEKHDNPSNFPMELLTKIWQFKHKNKDYYVAQKYCGTNVERQYSVEIFTILDGKPIYHTEFYPNGVSQKVCYSMNREHEIDFDFDPATLTVSYTTYEDDYRSDGKQIKGNWKLVMD